nr:MAG TPA: hypothetical protein [Inoviridae sp.]
MMLYLLSSVFLVLFGSSLTAGIFLVPMLLRLS